MNIGTEKNKKTHKLQSISVLLKPDLFKIDYLFFTNTVLDRATVAMYFDKPKLISPHASLALLLSSASLMT